MSSRTLRKLQRREQDKQALSPSVPDHEDEEGEEEEEEDENFAKTPSKTNAFDLLAGADDEPSDPDDDRPPSPPSQPKPSSGSNAARKGKNKKKKNEKEAEMTPTSGEAGIIPFSELPYSGHPHDAAWILLLNVDSKDLNPMNEMKRLFGNVALEDEFHSHMPQGGRRPARIQQFTLGTAFTAGPSDRANRSAGILRRNMFMPFKDEWPKVFSGGLGMEMVVDSGGEVIYEFVHSRSYLDIQRKYHRRVDTMNPWILVPLLQQHPFHVATILQMSEFAKHQGDHGLSADLLERALFTYGRSLHSSFGPNLKEGKARLEFMVQENREFGLTVWRYITSLCQRGTWRTAYEWSKLLLSVDPEADPYAITLMMDQLAIRARCFQHLIDLCQNLQFRGNFFARRPNIRISLALAYYRIGNDAECRRQLQECISEFPYLIERLFKELRIDPIPKSVWGAVPSNGFENMLCQLYAQRAKDLWDTPETIRILKNAAEGDIPKTEPIYCPPKAMEENEARHLLLLEDRSLRILVPRELRPRYPYPADPVPPVNLYDSPRLHVITDHNDEEPLPEPEEPLPEPEEPLPGLEEPLPEPGEPLPEPEEALPEPEAPAPTPSIRFPNPFNWVRGLLNMVGLGAGGDPEGENTAPTIGEEVNIGPVPDDQPAVEEDELADSDGEQPLDPPQEDAAPDPENLEETDQRTQRFLAGDGLQALNDFISRHGVDEDGWPEDQSPVTEYVQGVLSLRERETKRFILDFILPQGTSLEVKELIQRKAEVQSPGSTL